MEIWLAITLFLVGTVLLVKGADWLVDHAALLAEGLGVPHMVVGLTIVAFGTSAPELAAGIGASLRTTADSPTVNQIALGAVVGSNIANIALILGAAALVCPIVSARAVQTKEIPVMLCVMLLGWGAMLGGQITRVEGAGLFVLVLLYTWHTYAASKQTPGALEPETPEDDETTSEHNAGWWLRHAAFLVLGIVGLTGGAELLVRSSVSIAERLGVPELVVGLTMVALGTSLPELATAMRAAMKKHTEILVGNVIGSNVFNTLCVLGATAMVRPVGVPSSTVRIDAPAMLGVAVVGWVLVLTRKHISRLEGAVLLLLYATYVGYVIVSSSLAA